jgi:hypothetical protein
MRDPCNPRLENYTMKRFWDRFASPNRRPDLLAIGLSIAGLGPNLAFYIDWFGRLMRQFVIPFASVVVAHWPRTEPLLLW